MNCATSEIRIALNVSMFVVKLTLRISRNSLESNDRYGNYPKEA